MRLNKIITLCIVFLPFISFSQNREYKYTKMFWTETIFSGKIKGKFGYQVDYQYRRSADPNTVEGGDHNNIFKNPLQQVVRPWIYYQPNDAIRFSLSPLGWWGNWSESGSNLQFTPEFRITPQVTLNQKFGRVVISHRYRYEFRFFGDKKSAENGWDFSKGYYNFNDDMHTRSRLRYFIRALVPLNNATLKPGTFYVNTYNEIFVNIGKSVGNTNLFDQNRFFLGLGYRFNPLFRLEAGYLSQTVFRLNNAAKNNVDQNNVLSVFIIFDDFNKFFQRKEKVKEPK